MKKYPNINQYFNKTPKGYLILLLALHLLISGAILGWLIPVSGLGWGADIVYLAYMVCVALVILHFYRNVVTLARARLGRHLKKYYGLENEALEAQLDEIEAEMGAPVYADVSGRRRYNAFFITRHWLVGTDGVNLLRANACKREDIVKVDMGVMVKFRKGTSYFYHILMVTDKNNYTYKFWLRSQKNLELAYEKLKNIQRAEPDDCKGIRA